MFIILFLFIFRQMLVRLECLRWKVLHKPKVTLFSKPAKISLSKLKLSTA